MREFDDANAFWTTVLETVKPGRIAMSGGSALQLFDHLKANDFDWAGTQVSVVDERCVLLSHEHSNSGKIKELLTETEAKLNLFENPEDRETSISLYTETLKEDKEGYLFDLCVLGIGPDGHTASLFPQTAALDMTNWLVPSETEVFDVEKRMGLSFTAIAKSKKIIVLMIGAGKGEIFERLQQPDLDYHDYPAAKILEMPQAEVFWLDA